MSAASLEDRRSPPDDSPHREKALRVGDRVEWVGPDVDDMGPRHGERGWIVDLHPMDDVVAWDESGTLAGTLRYPWVRRVADENGPNPEKGEPTGR